MSDDRIIDGVKLKDEIQRKLQEEYEARKSEFSSYAEFIRAKAGESEYVRKLKEKMAHVKHAA